MSVTSFLKSRFAQAHQVPTDLYIGGQWVPGSGGARIDVYDPSSAQVIATVADATVEDALKCVDAASAAAAGWAATAPRKRAEILRKAFELMIARQEEFARLISLENGKSLTDARGEVAQARAKDHAGVGRLAPALANEGGGRFDLVVEFEHEDAGWGGSWRVSSWR